MAGGGGNKERFQYRTDPAYCILKASVMKSEKLFFQKVYVSPRPPPKISYKDNWMCDLDSDIAGRSKNTQRIAPKPKTQLSSTWRPVTKWKGEMQERTKFDRDTLNQEKHDKVTDPMSTGRHVCGHQSTKRCVLTHRHVENDQTGAGRPEMVDRKEEDEIDFRVPGLSHAVVKEAEHLRVQELVKRIETHPHREALHADVQQNDAHNPFSKDSKVMIRELGNGLILNQGNTFSLSLCARSFAESNSSSSSFSASTSRRGWSGSYLENRRKSSDSIPTIYSLV